MGPIRVGAREVAVALDRERVVALPIEASHVALHWRGQHEAAVTVAFSADGVAFGPAGQVEHDEVGEQRGNGETYGSVIHAAGTRFVRLTSDRPIGRLTVLALDSDSLGGSSLAFGGATAAAAISQPPVITRAGWGADESLRFNADGTQKWTPAFYPVQKLIIHHTAGKNADPDADPDPAATIRSVYYYHAITQGWGDIGYNFLVDESGRIYEGRYSRPYAAGESPTGEDVNRNSVTAAHVQGYNSGTVGIALLGTLTNVDAKAAARDAVERMLAWKAERHAIDPLGSSLYTNPVNGTQRTFANIAGHRDLAATECPGGTFYGTFPALRKAVAARIAPASTPPPTAPGAPSGLSATSGNSQISLSWSAPVSDGGSPITGYRIYRSTSTGTETFTGVSVTSTRYTDSAGSYGTTYYYRVSAVNSVGEGPLSNESSAKFVSSPSAPLNLKAAPHKSRGIVLSWSAPSSNGGSAITGYRIYRSTSSGAAVFLVAVGTVSTYRDTATARGIPYYYVVTAVNAVGESPRSSESTSIAK
ncbi:MAG TPA: fibronectin type III domain-containing protein [Candidatus Limnocylindria bacterium]|nr:fibronectin type III domain-containing protein [Candidatus Limnocylindria bacterium]